jgi:hypothetical protein
MTGKASPRGKKRFTPVQSLPADSLINCEKPTVVFSAFTPANMRCICKKATRRKLMIPAAQTHLALQRIDDAHGLPAGIVRRQVGIALRHFRIAVAKQN